MLALEEFVKEEKIENYNGIVLETAHPAKFKETVDFALNESIKIPKLLQDSISKKKKSILLSSNYSEFKEYLLGE